MRWLAAFLALLAIPACSDSGSTYPYGSSSPITGMKVLAADVTAGRGCGSVETSVFKYAVFVSGDNCLARAGLFDCFADGIFATLPAGVVDAVAYKLQVFAYNQSQYNSDKGAVDNAILASSPTGLTPTWKFACDGRVLQDVVSVATCRSLL